MCYATTRTRIGKTTMKNFAVCLVIASLGWRTSCGWGDEITAEVARQSIDRAIVALREMQTAKGGWPIFSRFTGGSTALCTLALLNAGVPKEDPAVARALEYLRKLGQLDSVYAASLQTMVFATADPERYRLHIRQNVAWLESAQSEAFGGWSYDAISKNPDNSNSQFAILALNEAARVGVNVDRKVWERAARYWEQEQLRDGSWGYGRRVGPRQHDLRGDCLADNLSTESVARGRVCARRKRHLLWPAG